MKVLQPNSIIVGTRKSWRIFPIKQKFDTTAAFFIVKMFKTRQKFGDSFLTIVHLLVSENTVRKIVKFDQIEHFGLSKKAAVVSNFCLIGKIHHNFLVPKMIELGRKTFMPIQTLDLHRVLRSTCFRSFFGGN